MTDEPTLRAVICDDDALSRNVVGASLRATGFEVIAEVDNAFDLTSCVRVAPPDVVVLDLALPAGAGEDALPELAAAAPDCAVVVFSSFATLNPSLRKSVRAAVPKGDLKGLRAALAAIADERRRGRVSVPVPADGTRCADEYCRWRDEVLTDDDACVVRLLDLTGAGGGPVLRIHRRCFNPRRHELA